jgi:LAO/AO transport system kinase
MNNLSTNANAFIRPSPAKGALGGVSGATRENIILFEAAGYNVIIVETVGVGQSETLVRGMVDFFLLLMLPGAGDELQGIKKGIMEMADGLVINKADGGELTKAKQAQTDYKNALHLFSPTVSGWIPQVKICSSLDKTGIDEVWKMISDFVELLNKNDFLSKNRSDQNMTWFREQIPQNLMNEVFKNENNLELKGELEEQIKEGKLIPKEALSQLIKGLRIK